LNFLYVELFFDNEFTHIFIYTIWLEDFFLRNIFWNNIFILFNLKKIIVPIYFEKIYLHFLIWSKFFAQYISRKYFTTLIWRRIFIQYIYTSNKNCFWYILWSNPNIQINHNFFQFYIFNVHKKCIFNIFFHVELICKTLLTNLSPRDFWKAFIDFIYFAIVFRCICIICG